jgi:hypothetical protein
MTKNWAEGTGLPRATRHSKSLANLAVHRALLNGSSIDKSALRYCVELPGQRAVRRLKQTTITSLPLVAVASIALRLVLL